MKEMKEKKLREKILSEVNSNPGWVKKANLTFSILLVILILGTMYKYNTYVEVHKSMFVESSVGQHQILAKELLEKTVKTFFIMVSYVGMIIALGMNQIIHLFMK